MYSWAAARGPTGPDYREPARRFLVVSLLRVFVLASIGCPLWVLHVKLAPNADPRICHLAVSLVHREIVRTTRDTRHGRVLDSGWDVANDLWTLVLDSEKAWLLLYGVWPELLDPFEGNRIRARHTSSVKFGGIVDHEPNVRPPTRVACFRSESKKTLD